MSPLQREQLMEYEQEDLGYVDLIQSVGGNWHLHDMEGECISDPFRSCGDAQEHANAEGYTINDIRAWKVIK